MTECKNNKEQAHHHQGKSSESLLDKDAILKALAIKPGQIILDAGCGNGYMTKEFAKLTGTTGTVYALDPDTISIEALESETKGTRVEPFVATITEQTKLKTSSLNLIYISTVIHGFSAPQINSFLKEVKRLLVPGGRLAIIEIKKQETPFGPPLAIRLSAADLQQALSLTPVRVLDIGQYFYMQIFRND